MYFVIILYNSMQKKLHSSNAPKRFLFLINALIMLCTQHGLAYSLFALNMALSFIDPFWPKWTKQIKEKESKKKQQKKEKTVWQHFFLPNNIESRSTFCNCSGIIVAKAIFINHMNKYHKSKYILRQLLWHPPTRFCY